MIYDLESSTGYQLTLAARSTERSLDGLLEEYALTRLTWVALVSVGSLSLSQPSRIADFMGLDRPKISRALGALEELGLIERSYSSSDARRVSVDVTRQGLDLLGELAPRVSARINHVLGALSDAERAELRRLLRKVNEEKSEAVEY